MEITEVFEFGEGSQGVRLPKEFVFEGEQVYLKRLGNAIILLPYNNPWEILLESLSKFSDDFMSE
jgi:antitoxin VapB